MAEGLRTTRCVALMAGNGFAFVKVFDVTMEHSTSISVNGWLVALSFTSFLGAALAYVVLWRPAHDRWAILGEIISANCIIYAAGVWHGFMTHLVWP
jgi:hypothetical protein